MTLQVSGTREAPAQTELRPTAPRLPRANPPYGGTLGSNGNGIAQKQIEDEDDLEGRTPTLQHADTPIRFPFEPVVWADALLILPRARTGYLPHHLVEIEARGFLSRWVFFEALEPLRDQRHSAIVHVGMMDEPLVVQHG